MHRFALLLLLTTLSGGCGLAGKLLPGGVMGGADAGDPEVRMLSVKPGGKALLLISPDMYDRECTLPVQGRGESVDLNCATAYMVSCDASKPAGEPFCTLVTEKDGPRRSAYPGSRR